MAPTTGLRNQFLLSMPHLEDPNFAQTLTYICDHSDYGAMGLIINRCAGMPLQELMSHLELQAVDPQGCQQPVYTGGPVHEDRGFVLHSMEDGPGPWLCTYEVTANIGLTTSLDILEALAKGKGPREFLVALGYAGWGPGQLEAELSENLWLSCPANFDIMFRMPAEDRLQAAASVLGINLNLLTANAGHA
ncbi:UPF0301 protein AlgH [Marinobacterium zhoushanense]|uniref:UPF0301 protein GCM10011352_24700 n=1 Tax=Marinobacterium zhoushanense TaxID=1679163 RepID=A0ABQ1KI77_9GAMM|nr:YqgE/AlgH family protein [Marinobacterium zhoushanense]GGB97623.1 UPF0301 protein AlgH [Marinobacterium zhoushanense]